MELSNVSTPAGLAGGRFFFITPLVEFISGIGRKIFENFLAPDPRRRSSIFL
jgi:hypothetical protein